ncbi:MAG: hypothetical protein HZB67_01345 [Candidatus Aenigmarchaeota archaeon]|nr:hypothetical protein [Candidatus Aenigmarchaeota archaeon]
MTMGIAAEYSPDLALRSTTEFNAGKREKAECMPASLVESGVHDFLKKGQRFYWLAGEIPLRETDGNALSRPKASVVILESTHFMKDGCVWTKGKYRIVKILGDEVYFEGYEKIK